MAYYCILSKGENYLSFGTCIQSFRLTGNEIYSNQIKKAHRVRVELLMKMTLVIRVVSFIKPEISHSKPQYQTQNFNIRFP